MIHLASPLPPEPNSHQFDANMAREMWKKHSGMFDVFIGRAYQKPYSEDPILLGVQTMWHMPDRFPSGMIATNIRMNNFSPPVTRLLWEYIQCLNPELQALKLGDNHTMRTRVLEAIDCRRNLKDIQWMLDGNHYDSQNDVQMFLHLEEVRFHKHFGYYPHPDTLSQLTSICKKYPMDSMMQLRANVFHKNLDTYDSDDIVDLFPYIASVGYLSNVAPCTQEQKRALSCIKNLKIGDVFIADNSYREVVDIRDIDGEKEYSIKVLGSQSSENHAPVIQRYPVQGLITFIDTFQTVELSKNKHKDKPLPEIFPDLPDRSLSPGENVIVINNDLHQNFGSELGPMSTRRDMRQKTLDILSGKISPKNRILYQESIYEDLITLGFTHESSISIDTLNYIVLQTKDRENIQDLHIFLDIISAIPGEKRSHISEQQQTHIMIYAELLNIMHYLEQHRGFDSDEIPFSKLKQYSNLILENFYKYRDTLIQEFGVEIYGASSGAEFKLPKDFSECMSLEELYWQIQLRGLIHKNLHNLREEIAWYVRGDITEMPDVSSIDTMEQMDLKETIQKFRNRHTK